MKKWTRLILISLAVASTLSCRQGNQDFFQPEEGEEVVRPEPYVNFTQAVNNVGPMVSPMLEDMAQASSSHGAGKDAHGSNESVQTLPLVNPLDVDTDMAIATDSELLPLNQALYQGFIQAGYSGIMDIKAMSTDTALQSFCQQNGTDLLTISRAMTAAERTTCERNGRNVVEFAIGQDALLLVVNPQDTFVKGVDLDTLAAILTQTTWAEVRSDWPNEPIRRKLIGPDSSAVALLAATLFNYNPAPIINAPNTDFDNYPEPMLQSLSTTDYGVGIVNGSSYKRSPSVFRAVPIGGITASQDTIESGAYPLGKILYLYADRQQLIKRSPSANHHTNGIATWINFYLTHVNDAISDVHLLPLNPAQLNQSKTQWLTLMGFNADLTQTLVNPGNSR